MPTKLGSHELTHFWFHQKLGKTAPPVEMIFLVLQPSPGNNGPVGRPKVSSSAAPPTEALGIRRASGPPDGAPENSLGNRVKLKAQCL